MAVHGDIVKANTLAVAAGLILLLVAPTLAVTIAGVRVAHIPAAGEAFTDSTLSVHQRETAVLRSSRLIDGLYLGVCTMLALSGATSVFAAISQDSSTSSTASPLWTSALAVVVAIVCAVQSRSHARLLPACATALTTVCLLLSVASVLWLRGWWPLCALIVIPLLSATAVQSIPTTGVTPTMRRTLELIEATAIATALPIAAIVVGLPSLIAGLVS